MFTGIVETTVRLMDKQPEGSNIHFRFQCDLSAELKPDQSIAHNGVCLTVTETGKEYYKVTAIEETLQCSNLGSLEVGDRVNFERCLSLSDRLDGHIVQGHVDGTGHILNIADREGSRLYTIGHTLDHRLMIPKGSITVNGVSLTLIESQKGEFSIALIPYTLEHTNFKQLKTGDLLNLELDVLGKYVKSLLAV